MMKAKKVRAVRTRDRVYMLCESCFRHKTKVTCFFCERPVCSDCHEEAEMRGGACAQYGDRLCSKTCARRYRKEKRCREEGE